MAPYDATKHKRVAREIRDAFIESPLKATKVLLDAGFASGPFTSNYEKLPENRP
jgi:hypothetical protein